MIFRGKEEVMCAINASFKMIRQLVETVTPATGVPVKWQPQGAEKGKGGNASSRRHSSQEESGRADIYVQKRSAVFPKALDVH